MISCFFWEISWNPNDIHAWITGQSRFSGALLVQCQHKQSWQARSISISRRFERESSDCLLDNFVWTVKASQAIVDASPLQFTSDRIDDQIQMDELEKRRANFNEGRIISRHQNFVFESTLSRSNVYSQLVGQVFCGNDKTRLLRKGQQHVRWTSDTTSRNHSDSRWVSRVKES